MLNLHPIADKLDQCSTINQLKQYFGKQLQSDYRHFERTLLQQRMKFDINDLKIISRGERTQQLIRFLQKKLYLNRRFQQSIKTSCPFESFKQIQLKWNSIKQPSMHQNYSNENKSYTIGSIIYNSQSSDKNKSKIYQNSENQSYQPSLMEVKSYMKYLKRFHTINHKQDAIKIIILFGQYIVQINPEINVLNTSNGSANRLLSGQHQLLESMQQSPQLKNVKRRIDLKLQEIFRQSIKLKNEAFKMIQQNHVEHGKKLYLGLVQQFLQKHIKRTQPFFEFCLNQMRSLLDQTTIQSKYVPFYERYKVNMKKNQTNGQGLSLQSYELQHIKGDHIIITKR